MKITILLAGLFALGSLTAFALPSDSASIDSASTDHRFLNAEGRSDSLPFSHAVQVGDTLYLAGTLGIDPSTGQPPEDDEDIVEGEFSEA